MAGSTTVKATQDKSLDGLLSGLAWDGAISFGFPSSAGTYGSFYGSGEPTTGFAALSVTTRDAVRAALLGTPDGSGKAALSGMGVAQFTLLDITEAAVGADIRLANPAGHRPPGPICPAPASAGMSGSAPPMPGASSTTATRSSATTPTVTVLHELGHALGLKHAHEAGGVAGTAVPAAQDSLEFTVMTYRSYVGGPTTGYTHRAMGRAAELHDARHRRPAADVRRRFHQPRRQHDLWLEPPTGEMVVDGAGQGQPGGNRVFLTLWDGGGHDTYDLSNYADGVNVDLAPGGWSVLSSGQLAKLGSAAMARGNVFNALQYQGDARSLIEDAIGGAGHDTLGGNAADNHLAGGAGNDSLAGLAGRTRWRAAPAPTPSPVARATTPTSSPARRTG